MTSAWATKHKVTWAAEKARILEFLTQTITAELSRWTELTPERQAQWREAAREIMGRRERREVRAAVKRRYPDMEVEG